MNPMNALVATGQRTGIEHTVEFDEVLLQELGWNGIWTGIQDRIRGELDRTRKVRPLLPVWADPSLDPDAIPDYTIHDTSDPVRFQIPLQARLVSVLISSEFQVSTAQFGDPGVALHLVTEAAKRVGLAEDAVLLHGSGAASRVQALHVYEENLSLQDKFLFSGSGRVSEGNENKILPSILRAIRELQSRSQYGEYCAIVAPNLYQAAFKPDRIETTDPLLEAPIHQIRPLLKEGGFTYSRMLTEGQGVVLSLGGGTLCLAVPQEAHLAFVSMSRDVILSVQERIRLLVNNSDAVAALQDP